jgi:hypothetical protein
VADDTPIRLHGTLLVFQVHVPDPNGDGGYITIKSPADTGAETLAMVEV